VTRFGVVPAELSVDSDVFGLRMTHQTMAEPWLAIGVGLDAEFAVSEQYRGGSLTTPPREGDLRVFGQRPADQVNADTWSVTVGGLAPYVEADAAPFGDEFHVIPGLRVEPQLVRASRLTPPEADVPPVGTVRQDVAVEPRLALRWNASDRVSAKAAFGIYHQPPLPDDLSAVFGNPTLGPANARHFLVGGAFRLSEPLTLEVTSFYSNSSHLAVRQLAPTANRERSSPVPSLLWLELLREECGVSPSATNFLESESSELMAIFTTMITRTEQRAAGNDVR
jgi:outer membrane receptor protein involved in Fe transport